MATETATFGGGCFWCIEAVFEQVRGVQSVVSGYTGGKIDAPTYEQVCGGRTGHAEVVQITFDPMIVSFEDLLNIFFATHDPTALNRQGADVGTQYRSAVFAHSESQRDAALQKIAALNAEKIWDAPIVTEVVMLDAFHPAEKYHQGYFRANPYQPYCQAVVALKVAKFRKQFVSMLNA